MEENGRRKDWERGKDLERRWSLGPKQDPLEMLPGSSMLLKDCQEISLSQMQITTLSNFSVTISFGHTRPSSSV
jgi:hypothetical protein